MSFGRYGSRSLYYVAVLKHLATTNVTDFTLFKLSMPVSVQCTDI